MIDSMRIMAKKIILGEFKINSRKLRDLSVAFETVCCENERLTKQIKELENKNV